MGFRTLKSDEIEVRVSQINDKGATLLLYKDARVDMNILDESDVKWKRGHELINGNLFCTVSIWDNELKEWVSRQDVGVESNTEKEKGQASDSFKRACFNWGIGRELYSAPFIWIGADKYSSFKNPKTGKPTTYDKFSVTSIGYNDKREINSVTIRNNKSNQVVFNWKDGQSTVDSHEKPAQAPKKAQTVNNELAEAKAELNEMLKQAGQDNPVKMKVTINQVLGKSTVDTVLEANDVMQAIEDGLV